MKFFQSWTALVAVLALAACSNSSGSGDSPNNPGSNKRDGVSIDMIIASDVDGEDISFTIHEPTEFSEGSNYPLILEGHGYGGSKVNAASRPAAGDAGAMGRLLDAGYGVISIDQRGFGEAGGTVRLFDPDFEGRDLVQIVDWAEANLEWLAYRNNNLLLGAIGGSYGGGYQHTLLLNDPLQRLDAVVPEITWHDLRDALFYNGVFKSLWATVLAGAGSATGNQDPLIQSGLASGLATNSLGAEETALLEKNSVFAGCRDGKMPRVDAMYWQSTGDTLFNLNETYRNYECVSAQGGDVRLLTKNGGHDSLLGGSSGEQCGNLDKVQAIVDWYDEKLKGQAGQASYIPEFCFHLNNSADDGVVTATLPRPTQSFQVPAQTLLAQEGSVQSVTVPLTTIGAGGAVIAGIPAINISISDPLGLELGDPIIFAILAVNGTELQANQVQPFRGYQANVDSELVGVTNRLAEGDVLELIIMAAHTPRYPTNGSTVGAAVSVDAMVSVPLLAGNLPAPPAN